MKAGLGATTTHAGIIRSVRGGTCEKRYWVRVGELCGFDERYELVEQRRSTRRNVPQHRSIHVRRLSAVHAIVTSRGGKDLNLCSWAATSSSALQCLLPGENAAHAVTWVRGLEDPACKPHHCLRPG